jgi:hypothetical protein
VREQAEQPFDAGPGAAQMLAGGGVGERLAGGQQQFFVLAEGDLAACAARLSA